MLVDAGQSFSPAVERSHRRPTVVALVGVLALEALGMLGATVIAWIAVIRSAGQTDPGQLIALAVLVTLFALGVGLLGLGIAVGRRHLLGAVMTWQFMQVAAAIGIFEGLAPAWIAWVLMVTALAGIVLSVIRPVTDVLGTKYKSEIAAKEARAAEIRAAAKSRRR